MRGLCTKNFVSRGFLTVKRIFIQKQNDEGTQCDLVFLAGFTSEKSYKLHVQ